MMWDNQLFIFINRLTEFSWIRFAAPIVTWLGDVKVVISALIILLIITVFRREWRRFVLAVFITVAAVSLIGVLLKPLTARPRPYVALGSQVVSYYGVGEWFEPGIATYFVLPCSSGWCVLRDGRPRDFSFPSGHTLLVFGIAGLLWSRRKLRWPVLVLAVLVGLSRIILGYHYPSDVLVGGAIGFLVGYFSQRYLEE